MDYNNVATGYYFIATSPISDGEFARASEILKRHAHKWREIGQALGFKADELDNIQSKPLLLIGAPSSYLHAMLAVWQQWAPQDFRGSTGYATSDSLRTAISKAGLGRTSQEL